MLRKLIIRALPLALCGAALAQTTPSVDDLIAKNTAARGGSEKVKALQSMKVTGKGIVMNGLEVPLTIYVKRPGLMRAETNLQGKVIVQAFDGTDSWSINPLTGSEDPKKADEETSKRARDNATSMIDGYLYDYKARGIQVEVMGKEDVEGSPAYKLKITTKDGTIIYDYMDAETYLDVKSVAKIKQGGQELEAESYLSNYKPEGGVMIPHSMEQKMNGQAFMKMLFDKVETNISMEDSLFKFPVKPDAKPEAKKQ